MTKEERLAKNNRIRKQVKLTREKRKSQICRVYRVKIDISHLNEAQRVHLKMLFVEAKWLYNDALTFTQEHDINDYNTATHTVHGLDKDKQPVTHELEYLGSQMKQSVIQGIKHSLKSLSALKKNNHTVGSLRYKSDYTSINLQQHRVTYRFYDEYHISIQGIKDRTYECTCGYHEDRDIHAARNMILLSRTNTCGTQGINAFGEDVRHWQNIAVQPRRIRKPHPL